LTDPSGSCKEIYLSPLLLRALEHNEFKPFHNIFKSDVYSLGMLFLYAATLQPSDNIYNYDKFIIDVHMLDERLHQVESRYGHHLAAFIREMLHDDEEVRPDFI